MVNNLCFFCGHSNLRCSYNKSCRFSSFYFGFLTCPEGYSYSTLTATLNYYSIQSLDLSSLLVSDIVLVSLLWVYSWLSCEFATPPVPLTIIAGLDAATCYFPNETRSTEFFGENMLAMVFICFKSTFPSPCAALLCMRVLSCSASLVRRDVSGSDRTESRGGLFSFRLSTVASTSTTVGDCIRMNFTFLSSLPFLMDDFVTFFTVFESSDFNCLGNCLSCWQLVSGFCSNPALCRDRCWGTGLSEITTSSRIRGALEFGLVFFRLLWTELNTCLVSSACLLSSLWSYLAFSLCTCWSNF